MSTIIGQSDPAVVNHKTLTQELNKAYGWGVRPDREKIAEIVKNAVAETKRTVATPEEYEFYKTASAKVAPLSPNALTLANIGQGIQYIESGVMSAESLAKDVRKTFVEKDAGQQAEFLNGDLYQMLLKEAQAAVEDMDKLASKIETMLYTRAAKGDKVNPFKDFASFAEYRDHIINLYHKLAALAARHKKAVDSMLPKALAESDTAIIRIQRAIHKHQSLLKRLASIAGGVAIAAGGPAILSALKVDHTALKALMCGIGTVIAGSSFIS